MCILTMCFTAHTALQKQLEDMEHEMQRITDENIRLNSESHESVSKKLIFCSRYINLFTVIKY